MSNVNQKPNFNLTFEREWSGDIGQPKTKQNKETKILEEKQKNAKTTPDEVKSIKAEIESLKTAQQENDKKTNIFSN